MTARKKISTDQKVDNSTITPAVSHAELLQQNKNVGLPGNFFVQPKLSIGAVNDPLEHEADAMADKVVRLQEVPLVTTAEAGAIQRKCAHCEEEEKKLQRKPLASFIQRKESAAGMVAPDAVSAQVQATKGSGSNIDSNTRSFMQSRFGMGFNEVKIHTGSEAIQMNRELNAKAFTAGNDIYFNEGQYNPGASEGKHLLAHELTHTIQQSSQHAGLIRRKNTFFGPVTGAPADWKDQVKAATNSAQKTTLIQTVVGTKVTISDKTKVSAGDSVPDPDHLQPYTASSPVVNFDENLQSKKARADKRSLSKNAGYTFQHGKNSYIVFSNSALDEGDYYQTVITLNHEFDHVNQFINKSTLTGNDSELDAWTTTFIREFHRTYRLGNTNSSAGKCFVDKIDLFAPLLMYFQLVTEAKQHTTAIQRIATYYTNVISSNAAHLQAFIFWLYRALQSTNNPDLGQELNTKLSLKIDSTKKPADYRQFPCAGVTTATIAAPPSASLPVFPAVVTPPKP